MRIDSVWETRRITSCSFFKSSFPYLGASGVGHYNNDGDRKDINIHYSEAVHMDRRQEMMVIARAMLWP